MEAEALLSFLFLSDSSKICVAIVHGSTQKYSKWQTKHEEIAIVLPLKGQHTYAPILWIIPLNHLA